MSVFPGETSLPLLPPWQWVRCFESLEYLRHILGDPRRITFLSVWLTIPRRNLDTGRVLGNYYYYCIFLMQISRGDLSFHPNSTNKSLWPIASELTFVCLDFLPCKIEITFSAPKKTWRWSPYFIVEKPGSQKLWAGTFLVCLHRSSDGRMRSQRWKWLKMCKVLWKCKVTWWCSDNGSDTWTLIHTSSLCQALQKLLLMSSPETH